MALAGYGESPEGALFRMLLLFFSFFSFGLSYGADDPISLYRRSPIEFHRRLREDFTRRRNVRPSIQAVEAATGDRSFNSLLIYTDRKRHALRLQAQALHAWDEKRYGSAIDLYKQAANALLQDKSTSEAAFTFYYIAEILAERDLFEASIYWINRGAQLIDGRNGFYLEALLHQSRAYSLWFLDQLDLSARSFSLALEFWQKIDYRSGIVVSWSNLATLYQELRMWKRADHCYRQALARADDSIDAEIRFFLHANYASFLSLVADTEALRHLEVARRLRYVSPHDFMIVEAQVSGSTETIERLQVLQPPTPSLRIRKARTLGRYFQKRGQNIKAYQFLSAALSESQRNHLKTLERQTAFELGQWLESQREFERAAQLYSEIFNREENLRSSELAFPYSRRVSPLFDGWIRCLIRLGKSEKAWREIQKLMWLRKAKAQAIAGSLSRADAADTEIPHGELKRFAYVGRLEDGDVPTLRPQTPSLFESAVLRVPSTIIEIWPDDRQLYVWITPGSGPRMFLELQLHADVDYLIRELLEALYSADNSLPPQPPADDLQRLYSALFQPLKAFLQSKNLLIIAHKELQNLPFEMLLDENGDYLLDHYDFSYLPSAAYLQSRQIPPDRYSAPVLIAANTFPTLEQAAREKLILGKWFDNLRIVIAQSKSESLPVRAPWIHVSTHFRLDDQFWWASGFDSGDGEINVLRLLARTWSCGLLSLAVCDAGNAYRSHSSYWLGLSELLLSRGIESLLLSRWRLDEASSEIYLQFFELCRRGLPLERALAEARRSFLHRTIRRGGTKVRGDHPFFWANLTYVGPPGKKLCNPPKAVPVLVLCLFSLFSVGLLAVILTWIRLR